MAAKRKKSKIETENIVNQDPQPGELRAPEVRFGPITGNYLLDILVENDINIFQLAALLNIPVSELVKYTAWPNTVLPENLKKRIREVFRNG